jgi:hypothetical protein
VAWTEVAGTGHVWATATMHRAYRPAYEDDLPYNISLVELDEGPKVWTNVVDVPVGDVRIGMRVSVRYDDVTDEVTLARFTPTESPLAPEAARSSSSAPRLLEDTPRC